MASRQELGTDSKAQTANAGGRAMEERAVRGEKQPGGFVLIQGGVFFVW